MGCDCVKFSASRLEAQGEEVVETYETALGYSHLPLDTVLATFRGHSATGTIDLPNLTQSFRELGLTVSGLESKGTPLNVFYQHFCVDGVYSLHRLSVLSVLLADESIRRKADALYCLYDSDMTRVISEQEAAEVVQDICDISLLYIPLFAELEVASIQDESNLRKVKRYNVRLSQGYFTLLHSILAEMVRNRTQMTYEEFVDTMLNYTPYIVNAQMLRRRAAVAETAPSPRHKQIKRTNAGKITTHSKPALSLN